MAALVLLAAGGAYALDALERRPSSGFAIPALDVEPGAAAPATSSGESTTEWTAAVADRTEIPARALRAYVDADRKTRATSPDCRISWATLAGIGRVESHHGTLGGLALGEDGRPSSPIVGIPLDGSPGVRAIEDSDRGVLDGDGRWDRAVGPMQFIPTTWAIYAVRASGDGRPPDPQNIDDAALAAANYLCAAGKDLSTGAGWWQAVMTYNNSVEYGRKVFSGADAYAKAASAPPTT
ncbi:murein transglycosylase [Saccharothrix violaceirubra]